MKLRNKIGLTTIGLLGLGVYYTHVDVQAAEDATRVIVQTKNPDILEKFAYETMIRKSSEHNAVITVDVPKGESAISFAQTLKSQNGVLRAEPDYIEKRAYTPNDSMYSLQYHHTNIQAEKAWERTMGEKSVVVAVIDDGIDAYHTDLKDKIVDPYDVVNRSPYTLTRGEHGTHVAGIIGGAMDNSFAGTGVAPKTSIMPLDVFVGDGAYASDVISAIYRAVDHGATIINMSLGSYNYSSIYQSAINYAHDHGVVVIAAAGNDTTSRRHYPSSYDHVVSVASTTSRDSSSYFSNYGSDIDIAAPGSSIYSTLPYNGFGGMSGTSMASPVVAGVAALVKANDPTLTNDEIVERLEGTADDLGTGGWDIEYGHGRVNAAAALLIKEYGPLQIDELTDAMTAVKGEISDSITDGTLRIWNESGDLIGEKAGLATGRFEVNIEKQRANQQLSIQIEDAKGNKSQKQQVIVIDRTAPKQPQIAEFTDTSSRLSGQGEAGTTVSIQTESGRTLGESLVDEKGKFSVSLSRQKAGTSLWVSLTDSSGNQSEKIRVIVKDVTPPVVYEIAEFTDKSKYLFGRAEPYTTILIKKKGTIVAETTMDEETNFSIPLSSQSAGTVLSIYAVDRSGNQSIERKIIVLDRTAPNVPKMKSFSDAMTILSGTVEKNSTVVVLQGTRKIGQMRTNGSTFSINIPKQKAGTRLNIYALDAANNKSKIVTITVLDRTAPSALSINKVTTQSTKIIGKTEPKASVYAYVGKQKLGSATADSKGNFTIKIKKLKKSILIDVYAIDAAKNKSKVKRFKVTG